MDAPIAFMILMFCIRKIALNYTKLYKKSIKPSENEELNRFGN